MSKKIRYHFTSHYVNEKESEEIAMLLVYKYDFIVHVCMFCKRTYAMDEIKPEEKNEYYQAGATTHGVCESCMEEYNEKS